MKDFKEIERLLQDDAEMTPSPELKARILERAATAKPAEYADTVAKKPRFRYMKQMIAAAAVFVLMLTGTLSGIGFYNEAYESVYIDVNPSVEIVLNRFEKINDVIYHNEDAERVFSELDLEGKKVNDGICMIIDKLSDENYIKDEAEVFITATSEKNKELEMFLEGIISTAKSYSEEKGYSASFSSQTMTREEIKEAHENGMSPARYKLIEFIKKFYPDFDEEMLNELDMKALQEIRKALEGIGNPGSDNGKNPDSDKNPNGDKDNSDKNNSDKNNNKEEKPDHGGEDERVPELPDIFKDLFD